MSALPSARSARLKSPWRFKSGAQAYAFVRGNRDLKTPVTFYRVEPYVIPKKSLTGANTERVDTRVLQVIYAFDPADKPVFVGQQVEVFIDAASSAGDSTTTPSSAATGNQTSVTMAP